jgi:hypothetical protein
MKMHTLLRVLLVVFIVSPDIPAETHQLRLLAHGAAVW